MNLSLFLDTIMQAKIENTKEKIDYYTIPFSPTRNACDRRTLVPGPAINPDKRTQFFRNIDIWSPLTEQVVIDKKSNDIDNWLAQCY